METLAWGVTHKLPFLEEERVLRGAFHTPTGLKEALPFGSHGASHLGQEKHAARLGLELSLWRGWC